MNPRSTALLTAIAALAVIACGEATGPQSTPNLLFIVSDTFRADALDCDSGGKRTPALCALAARGVVFENTYAGGPWTLPSSVSMLTGSHPTTYGTLALEAARDATNRDSFFHVPEEEILLADALAARGYEAIRFAEGGVAERTNVFQGMLEPDVDVAQAIADVVPLLPGIRGDAQEPRYATFIGALQYLANWKGQPFFLLVWIHDPHAIYAPPLRYWKDIHANTPSLPHPPDYYARLGHQERPEIDLLKLRDQAPFTAAEDALLRRLYHAEVQSVDHRVGQLLELLRQRGLEENTVVAFTSDHGEGFGEHRGYLHGNSFYDELLRVPLILAGPRFPVGRHVNERISHIDLMPTLCETLNADCMEAAQGKSLRPLLEDGDPGADARALYAVAPLRNQLRDVLIQGDYKLIVKEDETVELYHLARDAKESKDLAGERPEVVSRMRGTLETIRADNEKRRLVNLSKTDSDVHRETGERTLEQLRALGYVE